jgi:hypothetical protein
LCWCCSCIRKEIQEKEELPIHLVIHVRLHSHILVLHYCLHEVATCTVGIKGGAGVTSTFSSCPLVSTLTHKFTTRCH